MTAIGDSIVRWVMRCDAASLGQMSFGKECAVEHKIRTVQPQKHNTLILVINGEDAFGSILEHSQWDWLPSQAWPFVTCDWSKYVTTTRRSFEHRLANSLATDVARWGGRKLYVARCPYFLGYGNMTRKWSGKESCVEQFGLMSGTI